MTKKWIAINIIMLVAVALLGWQLYTSIKLFNDQNSLDRIAGIQAKKKVAPDAGLPQPQPVRTYNAAEFASIPAQNLFIESRRPVDNSEPQQVVQTPELPTKPILVGVIISGSQRMAMITDPTTANAAGGKRTQTMRPGDTYLGYVVTDITENSMVLELGTRREVIPLFDTSRPAQPGKTPILATRIVNFGSGQGSATPGAAVMAGGGGSRPITTTTTPPAGAGRPNAANPAQRGVTQIGSSAGQAQGAAQNPAATGVWNQTTDSQGRIIVNSPFGPMPLQQNLTTTTGLPVVKK